MTSQHTSQIAPSCKRHTICFSGDRSCLDLIMAKLTVQYDDVTGPQICLAVTQAVHCDHSLVLL